ncbi:hypothetical protein Dimus_003001 [Dionaea muscipula]
MIKKNPVIIGHDNFFFFLFVTNDGLLAFQYKQVRELPPKAEVIAWSDHTGIEMFRYGDHIMGIQGHPECDGSILLQFIDSLLQNNFITEKYANELRMKLLESNEPDKEAWRNICVGFLKGRL